MENKNTTLLLLECVVADTDEQMPLSGSTVEGLLHLGHLGSGVVPQQRIHGHDDPRSTETTLGAVSLRNSLLKHICHCHQWHQVIK